MMSSRIPQGSPADSNTFVPDEVCSLTRVPYPTANKGNIDKAAQKEFRMLLFIVKTHFRKFDTLSRATPRHCV